MSNREISLHARVVNRAIPQFHAISNRQLRDLGASRSWVAQNVRTRLLTPAGTTGVYTLGVDPDDLPRDTCAMVALLRTSHPSAIARETAAERQGFWLRGSGDLHVATTSVSPGTIPGLSPRFAVHSHRVTTLSSDDLILCDALPATSMLRTVPELGHSLTPLQIAHVIWNAVYAECLDTDALRLRLLELLHAPWTAAPRAGLELHLGGSCGTKSRSEDEFVDLVSDAGLPMPLVNVLGSANLPGLRLDFVWAHERVAVEIDGRHHLAMPGIAKADSMVREQLRREGWNVLAFHYSKVWKSPRAVVAAVAKALGK